MPKVDKLVEWALREFPETRNSDKELLIRVWNHLGFHLTYQQEQKFRDLPSTESIRRVRQRIQAEGKYVAVDRIRRARKMKGLVMQQNEPIAKPERIYNIIQQRSLF